MIRWKLFKLIPLMLMVCCACAPDAAERNHAGNNFFAQGDFDQAIGAYQAAQVFSPDAAAPYLNAADALVQAGNFEDALAALNQALKTADVMTAAQGYYNLGNAYFKIGSYPEAVAAYQQVLLRNPGDEDARYNLELALQQVQQLPDQQSSDSMTTTPTLEPTSIDGQTPTNEPGNQFPTPESNNLTPTPSSESGDGLSQEEAEQILDSVQQQQPVLPGVATAAPSDPSGKDW